MQGCISISMTIHQTTCCFVCSHLASGEKEGDELRRNADVAEILKNIQFPKICKNIIRPIPERIVDHEYVLAHLLLVLKFCFHFHSSLFQKSIPICCIISVLMLLNLQSYNLAWRFKLPGGSEL